MSRQLTVRESLVVRGVMTGKDVGVALREAGWGDWAQHHSGTWLADHPQVAAVISNMREEILFDAAESLRELIRGYAGLLIQEARLESMLGHDIGDLYTPTGMLKEVSEWPDVWRKILVTEIETRQENERSHDGETTDKQGGWDVAGEVKKIKRERALDIERTLMQCKREQREQLELIMKHKAVDAMVQPGDKLAGAVGDLAGSIDRAIAEGRQRASQRNKLPINVTPTSE